MEKTHIENSLRSYTAEAMRQLELRGINKKNIDRDLLVEHISRRMVDQGNNFELYIAVEGYLEDMAAKDNQ